MKSTAGLIPTQANALGAPNKNIKLQLASSILDSRLELLFMALNIPKKFSKVRFIIERLYKADDTFRNIYQDYETYFNALQFWEQSSSDDAPALRREYSELVSELEKELTQILKSKS